MSLINVNLDIRGLEALCSDVLVTVTNDKQLVLLDRITRDATADVSYHRGLAVSTVGQVQLRVINITDSKVVLDQSGTSADISATLTTCEGASTAESQQLVQQYQTSGAITSSSISTSSTRWWPFIIAVIVIIILLVAYWLIDARRRKRMVSLAAP